MERVAERGVRLDEVRIGKAGDRAVIGLGLSGDGTS
jgi:hypothetical protein